MKKVFVVYLVILAGVFGVLSVLGQRGDYAAEKKAWKLYQKYMDAAKDPKVIPDQAFEDIIAGHERLIAKYPQFYLTPRLHLRVGEIYVMREDFEQARKIFNEVINLYPDNREFAAEVTFKIAKTHEVSGDWVQANQAYQKIISEYPETSTALGIPIYIAGYHKKQNDLVNTMAAYEAAINYYNRMSGDYKGERIGVMALRFLSNCYLEQNRWNEAIATLGTILEEYSTSGFLTVKDIDMTVKTINIVSSYQLKDYNVAVATYRGIIERNPNLPLNKYLEKVIDAFKQLQDKGVTFLDKK